MPLAARSFDDRYTSSRHKEMDAEPNFENTEVHALFPCPIQISRVADAASVNKRLILEIKKIQKRNMSIYILYPIKRFIT